MALRLIELVLPKENEEDVRKLVEDADIIDIWFVRPSEERTIARILLEAENCEAMLDRFEGRFSFVEGFRAVLLSVEAALPRPKEPEKKPEAVQEERAERKIGRISREELYSDIADTAKLTKAYVVLVLLSAVVASMGILKGNVAVIIGAMVIAPLLGPNVALSLATTLGDIELARKANRANISGIMIAVAFAAVIGFFLEVDVTNPEVAMRTYVGYGDILLAIAAGSAASLAFTIGISSALVGVMVAVALLPPLVTVGLLIGSGNWGLALDALMLFLANLICVNLSGVLTFLAQGVRPISWWEADRAKRSTRTAMALWIILLAILIVVILISRHGESLL